MQRTDGTYDLPDASVSLVWQSEQGQVVRYNTHELWQGWKVMTGECVNLKPGRWLPWQPPTFPTRKKNPVRICVADFSGIRQTAAWIEGRLFEFVTKNEGYGASAVKNIEWLTPEYEDEV